MKQILITAMLALVITTAQGAEVASIFTKSMVLQQGMPVPVWGTDKLTGFEISGGGTNFVAAAATIKDDTVVVTSDEVKTPVAVRYNWANVPKGNLFNKNGLPATPFRTGSR